jgi:hypothetical protein
LKKFVKNFGQKHKRDQEKFSFFEFRAGHRHYTFTVVELIYNAPTPKGELNSTYSSIKLESLSQLIGGSKLHKCETSEFVSLAISHHADFLNLKNKKIAF